MSELINKEDASWKMEGIDALFLPHKAKTIKSIPLSAHLPVDKQIWACNSNGVFSVLSAYSVAMHGVIKALG